MKIPFTINNNDSKNPIVYTLTHSKKFIYFSPQELINQKNTKLILVVENTQEEICKKLIKKFKNTKSFFLIPKNLKEFFQKEYLKTIIYPVRPNEIIKNLSNDNQNLQNDLELFLRNDGVLFNLKNNLSTYLTETEAGIVNLLFNKRTVDKNLIKEKILKLHESIDTKSLESHLSRIRKKINEIDSSVELISINSNKITIRIIDQT
tara:strand:- start:6829 stop:7446 length:618 start_codon:yes stop_codon:yes gene_type:complete